MWVYLLDSAQYGSAWDQDYTPLVYGDFTQVQVEWVSGWISCNLNFANGDTFAWQACKGAAQYANGVTGAAFELQKNGQYIL